MHLLYLATLLIFVIIFAFLSLFVGVTKVNISNIIDALFVFDENNMSHLALMNSRIPRAAIGLFAGFSLGISGILMQALCKNPIASPSIFGVNAGAAFFIVLTLIIFGDISSQYFIYLAFFGAFVAGGAVFILGGGLNNSSNIIKMTLTGAVITMLFAALTQGLLVKDHNIFEEIIFWSVGSLTYRTLGDLLYVLPFAFVGCVISFMCAKHINVLLLGDTLAKSLGQKIILLKAYMSAAIILLASSSVAVAGPIALIGLIAPHIAKKFVGNDYTINIIYSGVIGAILLLVADISSRIVIYPKEVPVGSLTTIIGSFFFIYIARKLENK